MIASSSGPAPESGTLRLRHKQTIARIIILENQFFPRSPQRRRRSLPVLVANEAHVSWNCHSGELAARGGKGSFRVSAPERSVIDFGQSVPLFMCAVCCGFCVSGGISRNQCGAFWYRFQRPSTIGLILSPVGAAGWRTGEAPLPPVSLPCSASAASAVAWCTRPPPAIPHAGFPI